MSDSGPQNPPQQDQFSGSGRTAVSRHPYLKDSIASKRVSFYKSGDPQFSALRMVINSRTFRTFDALLDSLSKKVPLPFGVRNITTPRGVHAIRTLEELEDGKCYICSDQKKVKPFDLEMASRRLPPWYSARPVSARRRAIQLARQYVSRPMRQDAAVAVRTPKRLTVFRNGDPGRRHAVILQRKTTPTFESLLDYLSELLQFHVKKLYTPDGRRVDSLPALILCSGVVVAVGREHFKPVNYDLRKPSPMARLSAIYNPVKPSRLQFMNRKKKLLSRSSKSRNFSSSSERYLVSQINNSIAGSLCDYPKNPVGSLETGTNNLLGSMEAETYTEDAGEENNTTIMPPDDDIEKSFRINQDGSMTVEMKVRLTIKEEEVLHWTTTLSRTSVVNQLKGGCDPATNPSVDTPESCAILSKDSHKELETNGYEFKKESDISQKENWDPYAEETDDAYGTDVGQLCLKRVKTPGVRCVCRRQASVESVKTISETEVEEGMVGAYAYVEGKRNGEVTEEYCMVRQHSSRPIPKPRKFHSMEVNHNSTQNSFKSSDMAEVLQIKDNGEGISETMLYISEKRSYDENFFANTQFRVRSRSMYGTLCGQQSSSDTICGSSSNESEVELDRPYTASESIAGRKANSLNLPLDVTIPPLTQRTKVTSLMNMSTNYSSKITAKDKAFSELGLNKAKDVLTARKINSDRKARTRKLKTKKKSVSSSKSTDKKRTDSRMGVLKMSTKVTNDGCTTSGELVEVSRITNIQQMSERKQMKEENENRKGTTSRPPLSENTCTTTTENSICSKKEPNLAPEKSENPFNINTKETLVSMNKNVLDVLPPSEFMHIGKPPVRQKSVHEDQRHRETLQLSGSFSMPDLHSPSVDKYIKHWLEKVPPEKHLGKEKNAEVNTEPRLIVQQGHDTKKSPRESERNKINEMTDGEEHLVCEENRTKETEPHIPTAEKQDATEMKTHGISDMHEEAMESALNPQMTGQPDMKFLLEQLCQSIQAIRQNSQNKCASCLEKSNSLPDLSPRVTSTFGSYSKMLFAFLFILSAREGIHNRTKDDTVARNESCTEALKMMEALKKIATIEDANELEASLTKLQRSMSSQLMQSWRAFQGFGENAHDQILLSNNSDLQLTFEPQPEKSNNAEMQALHMQALLEQLGVPEKLKEKLSSLVNEITGDMTDELSEKSEEADFVTESSTDDDPELIANEAASLAKSKLAEDLLNGLDEETSSDHGIVVNAEVPEDSFAGPQIGSHGDSDGARPNDKTSHAKRQPSCAEKRAGYVNERSSCMEDEAVSTEKQDGYRDDRDDYSKEGSVSADERHSCAEDGVSLYQPSYVEEAIGTEEKACHSQRDVVRKEEQATNASDRTAGTEKRMLSEDAELLRSQDRRRSADVNATYAGPRTNSAEERGSRGERDTIYAERRAHFVENATASVASLAKRTMREDGLEDGEAMDRGRSGTSVESEASGVKEQESPLERDANKQNQGTAVEDRDSRTKRRAYREEEQGSFEQGSFEQCRKRNLEPEDSYEKEQQQQQQQHGLELIQGCLTKQKAGYPEYQMDNTENLHSCTDGADSCVTEAAGFRERVGGGNEMQQQSSAEETLAAEKLSCCDNERKVNREGEEEEGEADRQRKNRNKIPELHGSTEDRASCDDEKLASSKEEMHRDEEPSYIEERVGFDEKQDANAEPSFANQNGEAEEETSVGKTWADDETQADYAESCAGNVKDCVGHMEKQLHHMQEKVESVTGRGGVHQADVPNVPAANVRHLFSEPTKMQEHVKGASKAFVKRKKNGNELHSRTKDPERVTDYKKHHSNRVSHLSRSTATPQSLVDSPNPSSSSSSSLAFSYESNGSLKKDHEGARVKMIREMFLARSNLDQYGHRQLPSPNTSDLSDYRPETSDSGGCKSHASVEMSTESGEDDPGRQSIVKGYVRRTIEKLYGKSDGSDRETADERTASAPNGRRKERPGHNSASSLISGFQEARAKVLTHISYFNATSACDLSSEDPQRIALNAPVDLSAKVQSDKGRWLLEGNRLEPEPKPSGSPRAADTRAADDRREDASNDVPYSHFGSHHSPLEDLARPSVPKCTYLNLPNGCDSDPFQDDLSNRRKDGARAENDATKDPKPAPTAEVPKSRGERNGILPLAPIDFKTPDNKVHPAEGPSTAQAITEQPSRARGSFPRPVYEQDSLEMLHLICGEHCPIL